MIFDQSYTYQHQKLQTFQKNAVLAIAETICGTYIVAGIKSYIFCYVHIDTLNKPSTIKKE